MLRGIFKFCLLGLFFTGITAFAEVPVVDYSSDATGGGRQTAAPSIASDNEAEFRPVTNTFSGVAKSNQTVEQRLTKLENQISNLYQQDSNAKVEDLQQRLQKITGQFEEQTHQLEQLKEQLRNFYQDLDKRIDPAKNKFALMGGSTTTASGAIASVTNTPKSIQNTEAIAEKPVVASGASADSAYLKEQQVYQTAIDLLPDRKYEESARKLIAYINTYPKGAYVSNAHYWLGEIYFLQKKNQEAMTEFKLLTSNYPTSKKVPDAMLKMAFINDMQGKHAQAINGFKQVKNRFPNTAAGQLASKQLQDMGQ